MASDKPELVIIGDGETAELAHDYFVRDNKYTVVGFSAEQAFMRHRTLLGLPVVAFEELEHIFDPQKVTAFVAVSYTQFNRLRTRLFNLAKAKGYHFCSYISPQATISPRRGNRRKLLHPRKRNYPTQRQNRRQRDHLERKLNRPSIHC